MFSTWRRSIVLCDALISERRPWRVLRRWASASCSTKKSSVVATPPSSPPPALSCTYASACCDGTVADWRRTRRAPGVGPGPGTGRATPGAHEARLPPRGVLCGRNDPTSGASAAPSSATRRSGRTMGREDSRATTVAPSWTLVATWRRLTTANCAQPECKLRCVCAGDSLMAVGNVTASTHGLIASSPLSGLPALPRPTLLTAAQHCCPACGALTRAASLNSARRGGGMEACPLSSVGARGHDWPSRSSTDDGTGAQGGPVVMEVAVRDPAPWWPRLATEWGCTCPRRGLTLNSAGPEAQGLLQSWPQRPGRWPGGRGTGGRSRRAAATVAPWMCSLRPRRPSPPQRPR